MLEAPRFNVLAKFWRVLPAFLLLTVSANLALSAQKPPPLPQGDGVTFRTKMYTEKKSGAKMPYRLFVPPDYTLKNKYPLIFYFHGGSGRGFNNETQLRRENEPATHIWTTPDFQAKFPAFVLAPQCAIDENWGDPDTNEINKSVQMSLQILEAVQKDFSIDPDRIYIVGESMGGLGVWALLQNFPEKWAAALVLSSYDNFTNTSAIARVPLWLFQEDTDLTVPVGLVRQMVHQLKKAKAQIRYTEYHRISEPVWKIAFSEQDLLPWMLAHARGNTASAANSSTGNPAAANIAATTAH